MTSIAPKVWLHLNRHVRFGEIDSAGVVHFHQLFRWCHESWEESLEKYGLSVSEIFPCWNHEDITPPSIALPIVHCQADFRSPIKIGDNLNIRLTPKRINIHSFEVHTKFERNGEEVALALVRHMAINAISRSRCKLPDQVNHWIDDSD